MAMIKTDPSQTKAVVVLLIVLGGAIVMTIARINPDAPRQTAAGAATPAVAKAGTGCVTVVPAFEASRNPFRKPNVIRAALGGSRAISGVVGMREAGAGPSELGVMPVGGLPPRMTQTSAPEATPSAQSETTANAESVKPEFALLATVAGPNGMCAVIRSGESSTRVVAVGDIVEGGYKVQRIEKSRALLGNGVDTVVVKRPS